MKILAVLLSLIAPPLMLGGPRSELSLIPMLSPNGNSPRWDMSAEDLVRLYPAITKSAQKTRFEIGQKVYFSNLSIADLPVGENIFDAKFLMGPTGYLAGIQLCSRRGSPESVMAICERIKAKLTQQLRAPERDGGVEPDGRNLDADSRQTIWLSADTLVKLEYVRYQRDEPYVILEFLRHDP